MVEAIGIEVWGDRLNNPVMVTPMATLLVKNIHTLVTMDSARREIRSGALHDLVAALVLCQIDCVDYSFINGKKVVDRGHLTALDINHLIESTNRLARQMVDGAA
jgi:hypothetical protein